MNIFSRHQNEIQVRDAAPGDAGMIVALTGGFNLQTQGNGDDLGGTCSGDSGGPVFLGGPNSNLIVAVTSFGLNAICRGTDFAYRVDRQPVLDWIASH